MRTALARGAACSFLAGLLATSCSVWPGAGAGAPVLERAQPTEPSTVPPTDEWSAATERRDESHSDESVVAQATGAAVQLFGGPHSSVAFGQLANPQPSGAPLVFLVVEEQAEWLNVLLPVRPNGSTAWILRSEVATYRHRYRIVVDLSAHQITVYDGNAVFLQEPVAVGRNDTPTPGGLYYVKELLQPPDPHTVYGPYAYGLSGFSNTLTSFAGGEGVIGIHGNNDPSVLGRDVSSGCIRMSNSGIAKLAATLPLGVPVEIR